MLVDGMTRAALNALYAPLPRAGKNALTGWYHVDGYGADLTGATDAGPAINLAIAAAKVTGGIVYLPAGAYKILTCLDLSNIHPSSFHYNSDPTVTLRGAGKHQTILTGGETAYGFMELTGSNRVTVEHMSMVTTGTIQFGILGGRMTGDGSSGEHTFRDLIIYGGFTLGAIFMMSSEICTYDSLLVYTTTGRGVMLVRDQGAYAPVTKYTALSATAALVSGNGLNRLIGCQILSISPNALDYLLVLEYVQTFVAESLYLFSVNQTAQIFMGKLCFGATFRALQQEYSTVRPLGFYISAAGASPSSPDYRGLVIQGGRACSIYAEDATRLAELVVEGTEWRGADAWQIDVFTLYDSRVMSDTRNTSNSIRVTSPQYRVRSVSRSNEWGPWDTTTALRPSAVYRGVGARMFDTTISKPIWSDGTVWRDAAGTAV